MTMDAVFNPPPHRGTWRGPAQPWFLPIGWKARPFVYSDLASLARKVHRVRDGRGIQLVSGVMTWEGSSTFPCLTLYLLTEGNAQGDYAGAIAIQGRSRESFEQVLADTNPDLPEAWAA